MKRMRTIPESVREIKALDENTAVTENSVRNLCKTGKIRNVLIGNRYLVDLDDLINYFEK